METNRRLRTWPAGLVALCFGACSSDETGGTGVDTDTDTDTVGSSTSIGSSETDPTGDDTGDDTGEPPSRCETARVEGAGGFASALYDDGTPVLIDVDDVCEAAEDQAGSDVCVSSVLVGGANGIDTETFPTYQVLVYRPDAGSGAWPNQQLPLMVFMPGQNQRTFDVGDTSVRYYDPLLEEIARQGVIVIAIQPVEAIMTSGLRRAYMAHALIWAQTDPMDGGFAERDRVQGSVILSGHSRGGAASYLLANDFEAFQSIFFEMQDLELCAVVPIAPRWGPAAAGGAGDIATDLTVALDRSVPYFVLQGAIDDDTTGHGVSQHDTFVPEDEIVAGDPTTLSPHDKLMAWIYGVIHNAFGGVSNASTLRGYEIAQTVAPNLIGRFLRWQIVGDDPATERALFLRMMDPEATTLGDVDLDDSDLWTSHSGDAQYYSELERPLVFAQHTQGSRPTSATEDGRPDRLVIDTLVRRTSGGAIDDLACGAATDFLSPDGNDPVTRLQAVEITGLDPGNVCQGHADGLFPEPVLAFNRHQTRALRVDWDDLPGGGAIRWVIDEDVSAYTHLSVRLGSVAEQRHASCVAGTCEGFAASCTTDDDCNGCTSLDSVEDSAFTLAVELEFEDTDMTPLPPQAATTGTVPPQQFRAVGGFPTQGLCSTTAAPTHAMQTLMVPLRRFCEDPVATEHLRAITLRFGDEPTTRRVLVDSIELTRSPLDDPETACSMDTGDWTCELSSTFEAVEWSCESEPDSGVCPGAGLVQTPVAPPAVDDGISAPFDGFVVSVPRGWAVEDPHNPTTAELDSIRDRCARACDRHFEEYLGVVTNCSASGSFETPTLRSEPGLVSTRAIPNQFRNGAGLFSGEVLDCDLELDCCTHFDERLCSAAPARLTRAGTALGQGEEWQVTVSGTMQADSPDATGSETASITGTVGFSECTEGNSSGPCPFYLGSLEVEITEPLELGVTCDGVPISYELEELTIRLAQPAFGIAKHNAVMRKFPPGAITLEADGVVNGFPFSSRRINENPVQMVASAGWISMLGKNYGATVDLVIPCGSTSTEVALKWDFSAVAWPGKPPTIQIDVPSTVSCPDTVSLDATAADLDNDIESIRWLVDGVLLEESVTELDFTTSHELTAIVRDQRGATRTASKSVTCQ